MPNFLTPAVLSYIKTAYKDIVGTIEESANYLAEGEADYDEIAVEVALEEFRLDLFGFFMVCYYADKLGVPIILVPTEVKKYNVLIN